MDALKKIKLLSHLLILATIFLLAECSSSQSSTEPTNVTGANGLKQGLWITYRSPNVISSTRYFQDDQLHGLLTIYSDYPKKRITSEYVNGQKHGEEKRFTNNEELLEELVTYRNNQRHGPYERWGIIAKNRYRARLGSYVNDVKVGSWRDADFIPSTNLVYRECSGDYDNQGQRCGCWTYFNGVAGTSPSSFICDQAMEGDYFCIKNVCNSITGTPPTGCDCP